MTKKYASKKHRGVSDPLKQQEKRNEKIKDKINRPPVNVDSQEIPRKLRTIASFNKTGNFDGKLKNKKVKKSPRIDVTKSLIPEKRQPGMTRRQGVLPPLKQGTKENHPKFLKRVNDATKMILKEHELEEKFEVEVQRDKQGNVMGMHQRKNTCLMTEKEIKEEEERQERKRQARRARDLKRKKKKIKQKDEDDDQDFESKEEIPFGEVVHEPPSLNTAKITKKINGGVVKPKSFLFMEKIKSADSSEPEPKKKKKNEVSLARSRILEEERLKAVEAYRAMKANKHHNVNLYQ